MFSLEFGYVIAASQPLPVVRVTVSFMSISALENRWRLGRDPVSIADDGRCWRAMEC